MYMMSSHCIAVALLLSGLCLTAYSHSGLYGVNTTKFSKDFSAAWLISRSRFVGAEPTISTAVSMASATFSTIRQRCHNCKTLVTRDFFDFMVEHLSSATNQLPNADEQLFEEAIRRLQVTANSIKSLGPSNEKDPRVEQTIGLLVYSSICFSKHTQLIQRSVRPAFFVATFWSVHRYFKDIVIYVASQEDEDAVNAMDLPYKLLTRLQTPFDDKNRTSLLPRDSMLDLLYNMKNDEPFYKKYQYVFFSEGDQILHMREAGVMYDTIDNSGGTFITVPHRMQSLTLMQDFPEKYHHKWKNLPAQNIPDAQVVVQALHETKGSCCQNGDVEVAPCTGWWYQCPTYGIRDFKTWLKFGESGLTMPPVTEHKATCQYYPERTQCPLPKTCNARVPTRSLPHTPLTERDLCTEIVDTRYLGYGLPSVMPPAPVAATPAPKSPGVRVSVTQQQMQQQQPSSVLRDMAKPQPRPLGVNRAELLSPGERMQQSQQYLRQQQYLQQQQHLQQQQRRQHLEPVVVEPPRKPETRPSVMRPSATATTASSSAVVDMSDMGAFDTSNLDSIGENDNSIINNNYRTTDPIKSRRRKNRLRRRNRRIDTVTITANNNNNKQGAEGGGAGIAGNGRSGKTSAAGLRVTTIDDIQLA